MKLNTLQEVLIDHLRDLYDAEKNLVRALPKMAKASDSEELGNAFRDHLEQTKHHVERLEQVFEQLGEKPRAKACKAIRGLIEEGGEAMDDEGAMSDLAIIAAAQRSSTMKFRPMEPLGRGRKSSGTRKLQGCLGRRSRKRKPRIRS